MNMKPTLRRNPAPNELGRGARVGALAGSIAGLLLGLAAPFNGAGRPGRVAIASGMGALAGTGIGRLIWRWLGRGEAGCPGRVQLVDLAGVPDLWAPFREQVIDLPETAELQVITKQARQVEEVVVHPAAMEHVATIRAHVRHTEVQLQRGQGMAAGETIPVQPGSPAIKCESGQSD